MDDAGNLTLAIIVAVAATGSFLFAGWQSREVARQTRLGNQVAVTAATRETARHLDDTLAMLLQYPELRTFFYEGSEPPSDPLLRSKADTMAEMLADCLDVSLHTAKNLPLFGSANQNDWERYARFMINNSPLLRHVIHLHGVDWWPDFTAALSTEDIDAAGCRQCGIPD